MSETRKLAAILVSDVVGYSRLAGVDEDRILARLRTLRSDLIDPTIAVHHGRIVKRTGDGAIVEFRSVVEAVRCAIEIQNAMVERNAGVPEDRRVEYRIGVHVGDVVEESDGDLMGDGINIAARLEGICKPGCICLSEDAFHQVKGRLDFAVTDLGPTQLKNISGPVRVYSLQVGVPASPKARGWLARWPALAAALLVALLAAGYAWRSGLASRMFGVSVAEDKLATAPRTSIVVLPFENMSGDPEQEYFADGLTDDLTTDLSHIPGSFVIARNTAFTYKGKAVDAKEIGRELGVRYVLEGSVRRVGETISVNAQLISTETGAHVWADRFDGERSKLGQLQVDFVARLANSLGVELVKAENLRAMRERPNNPNAVDLLLRGWADWEKGFTTANVNEAIGDFERALQLDPDYTNAKIALAEGLAERLIIKGGNEAEDLPRAETLVTSALSEEPESAIAHFVKANLAFARGQFNDMLSELDVAIEIDRNYAVAYNQRGVAHTFLGRAKEAIPEIETALRLSPREPSRNAWEFNICNAYSIMAEWEKAVEWCQKSIATNAGHFPPYIDLAAAHAWLGHDAEAKAAVAGLLKLKPGFTVQQLASIKWSDDPQFQRGAQRIIEGLRKAGLPEGQAKTN
jgi:TolB-like protein/class 3 adenylate cyclase/tetratricopeptide (TPR) repeat protein